LRADACDCAFGHAGRALVLGAHVDEDRAGMLARAGLSWIEGMHHGGIVARTASGCDRRQGRVRVGVTQRLRTRNAPIAA
jgi:hypothetical protein